MRGDVQSAEPDAPDDGPPEDAAEEQETEAEQVPTQEAPGRRKVGGRSIVAAIAGALAVVAGVALIRSWWSDGTGQASDWPEPAPGVAERTGEFVAGEGSGLLEMSDFAVDTAAQLEERATPEVCRALQEEWAEDFGEGLVGLVMASPDQVLGELWIGQSTALGDALGLCVVGGQDQSRALAAAVGPWQELIDLRLEELGVEQ